MENEFTEYLRVIERRLNVLLSDKFAEVLVHGEKREETQERIIKVIGAALGLELDRFQYPAYWERLIKRKDCPQYMKELKTVCIHAYYPKLPIPEGSLVSQKDVWLSITEDKEEEC